MELQEIEIFIDEHGSVRIEVRGVKGPECLALTAPLEEALGNQVVERLPTPEMLEGEDQVGGSSVISDQ